jgi:hypothetical protein
MVEAFAEDQAPPYLLRDRQRAYVERLVGSIRGDGRDQVVVLGEEHLRKILKSYRLSPQPDSLCARKRCA